MIQGLAVQHYSRNSAVELGMWRIKAMNIADWSKHMQTAYEH